jgi:hypothetical protein
LSSGSSAAPRSRVSLSKAPAPPARHPPSRDEPHEAVAALGAVGVDRCRRAAARERELSIVAYERQVGRGPPASAGVRRSSSRWSRRRLRILDAFPGRKTPSCAPRATSDRPAARPGPALFIGALKLVRRRPALAAAAAFAARGSSARRVAAAAVHRSPALQPLVLLLVLTLASASSARPPREPSRPTLRPRQVRRSADSSSPHTGSMTDTRTYLEPPLGVRGTWGHDDSTSRTAPEW